MTVDAYMEKYNKTADQVAKMAGLAKSVISRLRHGKTISPENMRRLVEATKGKITYEDLVPDTGRKTRKRVTAAAP